MIPVNVSSMSKVKARVDLYDESTLVQTCTCSHEVEEFDILREGDSSKFFGFGICHKLNITFIDLFRRLKPIVVGNHALVGLGSEIMPDYPYPKLYVTEVNRNEKTNSITCTAYDKLYTAASHLLAELNLVAPYTVRDIAQACANVLGLTLKIENVSDASFNVSYTDGANFNGDETVRAILDAVAEVTQTIYFINKDEQLVFKRLDKDGDAVFTIDRDNYYELDTKTNRRLTTICSTTELGDNLESSISADGVTQYVRDNPLWELHPNRASLIDNAITAIGGITINQFDCDWSGHYGLEIGDKIDLVIENGSTVTSYVLSDAIRYGGTLSEITEWIYEEPTSDTPSNPTNIGDKINQTFARVDKVNKEIELLVSDVSDNKSQMAQIQLDLQGIDLTLKQHQEQIDNIDIPEVDLTEINDKIAAIEIDIGQIELSVEETSTKTLTDAKQYTDEQVTNVTTSTNQKIANLQVTTEGINAKVSSLQSTVTTNKESADAEIDRLVKEVNLKMDEDDVTILVTSKLEEGIDKVTTASKKYTFDDEGLSVSSSGNNLNTTITEDGMRIYRGSQEVLTANNEGVKAEDLHATTYLIIGNNSRLEDRLNRTACYWIGE